MKGRSACERDSDCPSLALLAFEPRFKPLPRRWLAIPACSVPIWLALPASYTPGVASSSYHPHIHYLVPAGAVSPDRKQCLATSENFFPPVQALSAIFRAKFCDAIVQAGLLDLIPSNLWQQPWVLHCQPVGDGTRALQYLARYVFRVAIANSRILEELKQGMVTFSFRDKETGEIRQVRLQAVGFIRRFLDHLLPSGFQKVRHDGFFSPTCSVSIERIRLLIPQKTGRPMLLDLSAAELTPSPFCPHCGGRLRVLAIQLPADRFRPPPPLANTG